MAKKGWVATAGNERSMSQTQPVYKLGDKEHRRTSSMNSAKHHYLYPNRDAQVELARILDPNHRALDMNNSYYMRG